MKSYFEVGVRYDKTMENGLIKRVTENYLVEALTFTEAEARATKEIEAYKSGEFSVVSEKITKISDVVTTNNTEADKYYKVKHNIIVFDEKSGKEKKQAQYLIVQASSVDDARNRYKEYVKGWIADVILESVSETKLLDYFPYDK